MHIVGVKGVFMIFATVFLISDATLIFRKESRLRKQTLAAWTERPMGQE
jgi:hypothetical protein